MRDFIWVMEGLCSMLAAPQKAVHNSTHLGQSKPKVKPILVGQQMAMLDPNTVSSATSAEPIQTHKGQQHFVRNY